MGQGAGKAREVQVVHWRKATNHSRASRDVHVGCPCLYQRSHRDCARRGAAVGGVDSRSVHHRQVGRRQGRPWRPRRRYIELTATTRNRPDVGVAAVERPSRQIEPAQIQPASRVGERARAAEGECIGQLDCGSGGIHDHREVEGDAVRGDRLGAGGGGEGGGVAACRERCCSRIPVSVDGAGRIADRSRKTSKVYVPEIC